MKKLFGAICFLLLSWSQLLFAQQVPNSDIEDWSGNTFNGHEQPAVWNYSNVEQLNIAKFNFSHKEGGHTGNYSMMVQDQDLKVAGIGETSPGYIALGQPWCYVGGLDKIDEATAGTEGGIDWTWRPDSLYVWIKRTGGHAMDEDFHILYYSWTGTAKSSKYMGKNGKCTSTGHTNEESDIRQSTDGNECGTDQKAHQISEGWLWGRAVYNDWTQVKIPIYYVDNEKPSMMNIIFSAGNYPNFRATSGLYAGNSLYIDDVQLVYSSRIQQLYIGGSQWRAFDPSNTDVQVYSLGEGATVIPEIVAYRGAGTLINTRGSKTTFYGRQLQGNEISIEQGKIDQTPTRITVKAEDGSSETTYQILFVRKASSNAYLSAIKVNGVELDNFNPFVTTYTVQLPYGTTEAPVLELIPQEDKQTVTFTQPSALNDVTIITVTAADQKTTQTYTLCYKQALLADNTLQDILVNGISVPGFSPTKTTYKVSVPIGTTEMPTVEAVSAYPAGAQTIVKTAPATIDGGVYQVAVSSPGNSVPKVYKLTFKEEASSYSLLKDIQLNGVSVTDFVPETYTYYKNLPLGTTQLPAITYVTGDPYQTVTVTEGGLDGTTRLTVTAGNGIDKSVYKIVFATEKSEISTLNGIVIGEDTLDNFAPNTTSYTVNLPVGTLTLPAIKAIPGDEYQKITILQGDIYSTSRITVTAGNGETTIYQLTFNVAQATDATLQMIYIDGTPLQDFDPEKTDYDYALPKGTTVLPNVTYMQHDDYQMVTTRSGGVNGDYKIIVRPQSGSSRTYTIHFSVPQSSNTALQMIYLDGLPLSGYDPEVTEYTDTLAVSTIPTVTYQAESGQKVISVPDNMVHTLKVTAESGASRTYTITFVVRKSESAFLKMIYLNGDSLPGFAPEQLTYAVLIGAADKCPNITVDKEQGQQVTVMAPYREGTAYIVVSAETGGQNTYLLTITDTTQTQQPVTPDEPYMPDTEAHLKMIQLDGIDLPDFTPEQTTYAVNMPAGSTLPVVTFLPANSKQAILSGATQQGEYTAVVTAENGDVLTYKVQITIAKYDNAYLQHIGVEGSELPFVETQLSYRLTIDDGVALPYVTYQPRPGQTVLFNTVSDTLQQLIVTAENGNQVTYLIYYTRAISSNALLQTILLNGDTLPGFDPSVFAYTDTLPWRTAVVPMVNAIGQTDKQVITTYFSAVNGVTRIHVLADDGITEADYTIAFPVRKSANTALSEMYLETEWPVEIDFNPETTDYTIQLPYSATQSPRIIYTLDEPEQTATYLSRPLGQANLITVKAENGDTRVYSVTFTLAPAEGNLLQSIYIAETGAYLDLSDTTQRDFDVVLPYGATDLSVSYGKSVKEQTVLVQPGGIYHPTQLLVYLRTQPAPTIYTLNPIVTTQNPAVLSGITIDGTPLADFDPNRLSYIINRTSLVIVPQINVSYDALRVTSCEAHQDIWHWEAAVTAGGYTQVYTLYWHYVNEDIPNGDFTEWVAAASTGTPKPMGWNATTDYVNKYDADQYIQQDGNSVVRLYNKPNSTLDWVWSNYKCAPAIINLASMAASQAVAGGSHAEVSGTVGFHNTPDYAEMNYRLATVDAKGAGALFRFKFEDNAGQMYLFDHKQTTAQDSYGTFTLPLDLAGKQVKAYDVIVDAASAILNDGKGANDANLYVDYIRFGYDHTLKAVQVNGINAVLAGNTITATLTNPAEAGLPTCVFTGTVADQSRQLTWQSLQREGDYEVRTGQVTNYAEDGSYGIYDLIVRRPLETRNVLSRLKIGTTVYANFDPEKTEYTYRLSPAVKYLPDVVPVPVSGMQRITTSYNDSTVTITVTPEKGESLVYTIRFYTEGYDDATLRDIQAEGLTFDAAQHSYTIVAEQRPTISFTKQYDEQVVWLHDGILDITASDGTKGQYRINWQRPQTETVGQLTELELDGNILPSFAPETYDYKHAKPQLMSFVRSNATDSVVYTRGLNQTTWQVFGTQTHTYTVDYPVGQSDNTLLQGIYVGGELLPDFSAQVHEYTLYTDTAVQLTVVPAEAAQTVQTVRSGNNYTITVTAANGVVGTPYQLTVSPTHSSDATLQSITLDGQLISNFRPDSTAYTVTVACDNPKAHEPLLPSVQFVPTSPKAQVEILPAGLNETTYLIVTSEDNTARTQYALTINSQKSHNAYLSAIMINDIPVDHFEPTRSYYSYQSADSNVTVSWRSEDRYQQVTEQIMGAEHVLHVVSEDGLAECDYVVEILPQILSNDATLQDILLDGQPMANFLPDINAGLAFNAGQNIYTVRLLSGTTVLPEINALLGQEGQTIVLRQQEMTVYLDVTAPDGVSTNTYTLAFRAPMSENTTLQMIYLNGDSLPGFNPSVRFYVTEWPFGTPLPELYAVKAESRQTISEPVLTPYGDGQQATIQVTAEDKQYKDNYAIIFRYTYSDADTLLALYGDETLLPGFAPQNLYYTYDLPIGTIAFPDVSWEQADALQTVRVDTVFNSASYRSTRYTVTAQSGRQKVYVVTYRILTSDADTLNMIYVRGDMLPGFEPEKTDYTYPVSRTTTIAPTIDYQTANPYQQVTIQWTEDRLLGTASLGMAEITVTAQNGNQRVYTVHFSYALSADSTLAMIYCDGEQVKGFDEMRSDYLISLPYGIDQLPLISYDKSDVAEQVDLTLSNDTVRLYVLSEDGLHSMTYTLAFRVRLSPNAYLEDITMDDASLETFQPTVFEYEYTVPTVADIPTVTYVQAEQEQTVSVDTTYLWNDTLLWTVQWHALVTAPDGENENEYTVLIRINANKPIQPWESEEARLQSILIKDQLLTAADGWDIDYNPDSLSYHITYPVGTDVSALFAASDVVCIALDTLAVVQPFTTEVTRTAHDTADVAVTVGSCIHITVVAPNQKTTLTYHIYQDILLDDQNHVTKLFVEDYMSVERELDEFNPYVFEYEYVIPDSRDNAPGFRLEYDNMDSRFARYEFSRGVVDSIPFLLTYRAEDGTKYTYSLYFRRSDIKVAQKPMEGDVLLQHIPGSCQIAVATLRTNVVFTLYDMNGSLLHYHKLTPSDPNNTDVTMDGMSQTYFASVFDPSTCMIITLNPNRVYLWAFLENGKRTIKSGKIVIAQ